MAHYPANIYLFKPNNRNIWKRCEIGSKLTTNIPQQRHWHRSIVFIFTKYFILFSSVSIVDLEQVIVCWVSSIFALLLQIATYFYLGLKRSQWYERPWIQTEFSKVFMNKAVVIFRMLVYDAELTLEVHYVMLLKRNLVTFVGIALFLRILTCLKKTLKLLSFDKI